jgi:hypothetical protein
VGGMLISITCKNVWKKCSEEEDKGDENIRFVLKCLEHL